MAGILFIFCGAGPAFGGAELAEELIAEGDASSARVEARRALLGWPGDPSAERVLAAIEAVRDAARAGVRPWGHRPVRAIVHFYRRQIGPAIGMRCSLTPSCSEYFLQAGALYGWLAVPMIGDRLVREPSVTAEAEHPLPGRDSVRFADPVAAHAAWHNRKNKTP